MIGQGYVGNIETGPAFKERERLRVEAESIMREAVRLRDQFAMAALPALIAWDHPDSAEKRADLANLSYRIADAMLEARKAK